MLADIRRHSRFTDEEYRTLSLDGPPETSELRKGIQIMLDEAESFISVCLAILSAYCFLMTGESCSLT
jgi:hypothetical protein